MKKIYAILTMLFACIFVVHAQIINTTPEILQESSKNVTITYNAELGNGGLAGLNGNAAVYAHIGVITNLSTSDSDWKYVVADWNKNVDKARLSYVSPDVWKLSIGDLRTYFGITNSAEHIKKIALVFRTGDGSREGKTATGGDILVDVMPEGFYAKILSDVKTGMKAEPGPVTLTAVSTQPADLQISVNGQPVASQIGSIRLEHTYNIETMGEYRVSLTASNGTQTITDNITIDVLGKSTSGTYPGGIPKMGGVKNSDGSVTFCIAAPGKENIILVPSWADYKILPENVMQYQDYQGQRYFFTTVSGLRDDVYYPYYYIVDGRYKVADPYARLVLDNNNDKYLNQTNAWPDRPLYPYDRFDDTMLAVYRGDMDTDFEFSPFNIPDHHNLIIYEMLFRDFTGTEGKANAEGTINKALAKLDYLKSLGVNAVELMPVMEFNGNESWGYNTNFYFAPDKVYGSPYDLKNFVEECHRRGIAIILDIVFNQSDGLHPWYQMYGGAANNPFYNQTAPHAYSVLNDWKQENPLVLQQWKDAIKYWMTVYNVDGFRFDLVKGLGTSYSGSSEGATNTYNASRVARMKELHAAIKAVKPNGIHINENLAEPREENEMADDGQLNWANVNYPSAQFAMGYAQSSDLRRFNASDDNRNWGSTVSYAESHDEERVAYKQNAFGVDAVKKDHAAAMQRLGQVAVQMLAMPGPKMIWQFGEFGADQTTKTDIGNDVSPKRVVWSYLEDADRKALHDTYRAMCHFRTHNPSLFANTSELKLTGFGDNVTSPRIIRLTNGDTEMMVFINPNISGADRNVGASAQKLSPANSVLIASHKGFEGALTQTGVSLSVTLPPNGYAVYATKNVAGVDDVISDASDALYEVIAGKGEIIVRGEFDNAQVYDLSGRMQPMQGLVGGIYIVSVDGQSHKVRVF